MITSGLIEELRNITSKERVREKEILAEHCSFRTGGPADLYIQVSDREELEQTLRLLTDNGVDVFLLGRGTNLLIGDGGYRGAVVTMCLPGSEESALSSVEVDGCRIKAGGGATLHKIAAAARDAGLSGFEFAAGIPGSLGGAIVMNAGAYGGEMKQVVRSVKILFPGEGTREISADHMEFGYRTSLLKRRNGIVLSAEMELVRGDKQAIADRIAELAQQRVDKQPLEFASAGSTFSNIVLDGLIITISDIANINSYCRISLIYSEFSFGTVSIVFVIS